MKSLITHTFLLLIVILLTPGAGTAERPPHDPELFNDEVSDDLWYITLEMDLDTLFSLKRTNDYLPAKFSFKDESGQLITWDIKVRSRGRFRRMKCEFPPLMLKFPKKKMKEAGFGKHNDVKLVTHCTDDKQAWENLFREYLAYQLYAQLTPVRLETRLLRITYRDTGSGEEMVTYGIFIEDVDALAERMQAKKCDDCYGLRADQFDRNYLQIHDLFQYMIGNTDWSLEKVRNLKILVPQNEGAKNLVAPYDFDFSALVDAEYAQPNVDFQQTDIRQRIYLGGNWTAQEWESTIALFREKRPVLSTMVDEFKYLKRKARRDILKFIDDFYTQLDEGYVPRNQHF
jgi:hypothetical protein